MNKVKARAPQWGSALYCAVTQRAEDPDGFYNTGIILRGPDSHVWISSFGARLLAEAEGYISPETHQMVVDDLTRALGELDQAIEEISELRKWKESVSALADDQSFHLVRKGGAPSKGTRPEVIREELKGEQEQSAEEPELWGKKLRGKDLKAASRG